MKLFTSFIAITALLAVSGPSVADEATATSAAGSPSLLATIRADVTRKIPEKQRDFPDLEDLTLLGWYSVKPDENGRIVASAINNGQLDKVFKTIVHLNWTGDFQIPQDGDFILTVTRQERCTTDYKIGGEQFSPIEKKRDSGENEDSNPIKGTSKGEWVEIDFTHFCPPTTSWKTLERTYFYLDAFFLNTGESVRIEAFRPPPDPS